MRDRLIAYIVAGGLFLGIGQLWAGSIDGKAREAEAAADAAWAIAKPLGAAVRVSRARVLHVSDSLQALVVSAEARADEAAQRASEAVLRSDSLTVEIGEGRMAFRSNLGAQLLKAFDRLTALDDQRHEEDLIAISETKAEAFEFRQALRTMTTDRDGLLVQIDREALAQTSLNDAIRASQEEAARWKRAARPGFVLGLWKDLPKLLVVGGAAYLWGQSGG